MVRKILASFLIVLSLSSSSDNDPGVSLIDKFLKKKGASGIREDDMVSDLLATDF